MGKSDRRRWNARALAMVGLAAATFLGVGVGLADAFAAMMRAADAPRLDCCACRVPATGVDLARGALTQSGRNRILN